jgi:multiple sugar transport system substrate-binding protein/raffinose/stachyose/melibiose transport system substrate-binding protein
MQSAHQQRPIESLKLSRRQFVIGLAAIASTAAVTTTTAAAPAPAPFEAPAYQAQRQVSLWHIFSTLGSQETAMNAVIADFQKTHSGITVVPNEVQREDIKVLAPSVMRTSRAPDVIQYRVISTARIGYEAGLVLDISDMWQQNGWEQQFGSLSSNGKWKGKYWNVPWNVDSFPGFWFLTDDWQQRGLAAPTNFDQLEQLFDTYKAANTYPLLLANIEKWHMPYLIEYLILGIGGRKTWVGLTDGSGRWTDAPVRASFSKAGDWLNKGYVYPNMNAYKIEEVFPFWLSGQAALIPGGSWLLTVADSANRSTAYFPQPRISPDIENAVVASTEPFSIPAKAEHPEEAKLLLAYLASPQAQQIFANVALQPMSNVNVDHTKLPAAVQQNIRDVRTGPVVLGFDWDLPEPVFTAAWAAIQQFVDSPTDDTIEQALNDTQAAADSYFKSGA